MIPDNWPLLAPLRDRAVYLAHAYGAGDAAEDVAHDVLLRLAGTIVDPDRLAGLLHVAVRNRCRDLARGAAREAARVVPYLADERLQQPPDERVADLSYARCVTSHLHALPHAQQAAILGAAAGHDAPTTARVFATTPGSVRWALACGRQRMRQIARAALLPLIVLWRHRRPAIVSTGVSLAAVMTLVAVTPSHPEPDRGTTVRLSPPEAASSRRLHDMRSPTMLGRTARRPTHPSSSSAAPPDVRGRTLAVPPTDLGDGRRFGGASAHLDNSEPIADRVARCARNGVDITLTLNGGGVTCREDPA